MKLKLLAATAALALAGPSMAANLVTNPGFENGSAGWNFSGFFTNTSFAGVAPHTGSLFASTGCVSSYCFATQTIATAPGKKYVLDFYFDPGLYVTSGGASTLVSFGGVQVGPDIGVGPLGYQHFTYTVTATTASSVLQFAGFQNPAYTAIDDVSLTAVPEPAAWALMIAGFGLVGTALRRRPVALAA